MGKDNAYDLILVGSGFASCFFLHEALQHLPENARVLILERGNEDPHRWQVDNRRNSSIDFGDTYTNPTPEKPWVYTPGLGGGSNAWWGCAPRFLPNDFRLKTTYGVGADWPLVYSDLEPFYCDAEDMMAISGDSEDTPFERSRPYPQPPHRFTDPDRLLKNKYPDAFFHQPSARTRQPTVRRDACCAMGTCGICPTNAKFTIPHELIHLFKDPRVTVHLRSEVLRVQVENGIATAVTYLREQEEVTVRGEVIALGANALFNPWLLMRSGLDHPVLGQGLHEQVSQDVWCYLDGVDNFQGSTSITGHGYMLYDGPHRAERAGALIETWNVPTLRLERGRWRQILQMKFIFEDLPQPENCVVAPDRQDTQPTVRYSGPSAYTRASMDTLSAWVNQVTDGLPVEGYSLGPVNPTESNILGTAPMGADPATSIVDRYLVHHQVRNLLVLGGSSFPVSGPANPTLTLSALSLWAARKLYGSAAAS